MKKTCKKLVSLLLTLVITLSVLTAAPFAVSAADENAEQVGGVQDTLNSILSVYPTGSYFTASGNVCYSNSSNDCKLSNIPSRGGLPSGSSVAAVTGDAWSCCSFARYVFYCTFGVSPESCSTVSSSNAQIGDYMNLGTHYAIYLGQDSTYWYVYDSNYTSPPTNVVKYNRALKKSNFSSVKIHHAPNYSNNPNLPEPVDLGTDFYAYIKHQSTGMYLTNQNTNVAGETPNGTNNQIWKFVRQSNGAYSIQSCLNGHYMDVYGVYDEDNANVYTWSEYTGGANQQFYIYYQYDAYYFRPAHSYTRRLDMSSTEDHNLSIWGSGENWSPQEFDIIKIDSYGSLPVDIGTDFYAYIEHQSTGMYLTNQNTNVAGETPNGTNNQIWKFVRQSNGAYSIQSCLNGHYMDVYGVYDEDNTNVYTWSEYTGGANQQFYIYYQYDAYYFRPAHSYTRRLDMSSTEDHNLSIWGSGENWSPQEFDIKKITENDIGVHKFVDTIVPPTINSEGYTEHTCSVCGYSYKDTYTYLYDINSLDLNITLSNNSYTYDGTAKTPNVIVSNDTETLIKDTDYTVEYSNNINTGTATVTVTGIGNYTGVLTKTFTITNAIGDVDGDGIISVSDATALQKQLANGVEFDDEMLAVADTNGDGIVSVSDATLIQKYLAGNASSLG